MMKGRTCDDDEFTTLFVMPCARDVVRLGKKFDAK